MSNHENLLRPMKIAGLTLKNRMLSAPTSLAELGAGGHYSQENFAYYKYKALGGAALVTVGDVIVDGERGVSHPQQVCMDDPGALPYLVQMADAIHQGGAAAGIELDHGGALCTPEFNGGKNSIGPSGYVDDWGDTVEEMTEEQILEAAEKFGEAAALAKKCGFDLVMIHSGHGWLLHQFISPVTNHRQDKWGGSFENRMRFPLLVMEKVRAAVGPQFPIEVRISGSERMDGGFDLDTGVEIAKAYDGIVDLIHVSAGSQQDLYSFILMHPGIFQKHAENSYLAEKIKKHVKTPVVTVGAWNHVDEMEAFLKEGHADAIAMGRALLADPFLPKKVLTGRKEDIRPCLRCGQCQGGMMENRVLRCTVNPMIGREREALHPLPIRRKGKVMIAGGGPAGMQAALEAADGGNEVVLYEERKKLGGALKFADETDFKITMKDYREYLISQVQKKNIRLELGQRADADTVRKEQPDLLLIAVGASPILPPLAGADSPKVVMGADMTKDTPVGENVVIIGGGMIGCEQAVHLAREGKKVALVEMREEMAVDCVPTYRINLMHQVDFEENITQLTSTSCLEISEEGVKVKTPEGVKELAADTVVMAAGMRANTAIVDELRGIVPETYVIGDGNKAGRVLQATQDAHNAVAAFSLGIE